MLSAYDGLSIDVTGPADAAIPECADGAGPNGDFEYDDDECDVYDDDDDNDGETDDNDEDDQNANACHDTDGDSCASNMVLMWLTPT